MNGTGHNSIFSTWQTSDIFVKANGDKVHNIASDSDSDREFKNLKS